VITATGIAGQLNGESNLRFNGSLLSITGDTTMTGSLGIGITPQTNYGIRVARTITSNVDSVGISSEGQIQSGVTNTAHLFNSVSNTQATTFTLANLRHYIAIQGTFGAGSTVTSQTGFLAESNLTGATNNFGFIGAIPSGINRWNLYMNGTANNYLAGSLGIGTTSITATNLVLGKNITGNASSYAILSYGFVQSDVTTNAYGFLNQSNTQVASFTLGNYFHYATSQGTIGGGSSITTQTGFYVSSTLTGATNNIGFRGLIPSAANNWNLYMDGTANNYLEGDTSIGTTSLGTATKFTLGGSETAVSAIARGQLLNTTLVASANDDVLVGLDIAPTFTNGAFTNVRNFAARFTGRVQLVSTALSFGAGNSTDAQYNVGGIISYNQNFSIGGSGATLYFNLFNTTGNIVLQNGGAFTDAGYRLDVSGTTRIGGVTTLSNLAGTGSRIVVADATGILSASSALSGYITGGGTNNFVPKFTGSTAIGNSNIQDSGTLVTLGSNTYVNGLLGVGATPTVGYSVYISRNITGNAVTSYGIANTGTVLSDVTGTVYGIINQSNTQATSFTLSTYIHYGTSQGNIGAGSAITNQFGFVVGSDIVGATNNYGFRGAIPSGTNRWNIYMDGTANNYMAGNLGIGTTSLTGYELRIGGNITGAVSSYGVSSEGIVQSDVTTLGASFSSLSNTQATSFTLLDFIHYRAGQGTIGAGSTVTNQTGFLASATLLGATNNYGFYGNIGAGTNRWNLYMNGTANNYMAGSLGIGGFTELSYVNLYIQKLLTGLSTTFAVLQKGSVQSDVTSASYGFYNELNTQATTFTLPSYTHFIAAQGTIGAGTTLTNQFGFRANSSLTGATNDYGFYGEIPSGATMWNLYMVGTANNYMAGGLGIGSTSVGSSSGNLNVSKTLTGGGGANAVGISSQGTIQSDITNTAYYYYSNSSTAAAAFNVSAIRHYAANQSTIGAGSSIGIQVGFSVLSGLIGATNNFGFRGEIPSGTGRWNLYMDGTAQNYLAGDVGIGVTVNDASAKLQVDSTTEGFLPPRMTAAQRTAISSPATGLIVYQTDGVEGLWVKTSTVWRELTVV
jgi:hypothetical protein